MNICKLKVSFEHPFSESSACCFLGARIYFFLQVHSSLVATFNCSHISGYAFMFKCSNRAKMLTFLWICLHRKYNLLSQLLLINCFSTIFIHSSLGRQLCLASVLNKGAHMSYSIHLEKKKTATTHLFTLPYWIVILFVHLICCLYINIGEKQFNRHSSVLLRVLNCLVKVSKCSQGLGLADFQALKLQWLSGRIFIKAPKALVQVFLVR